MYSIQVYNMEINFSGNMKCLIKQKKTEEWNIKLKKKKNMILSGA